MVHYELYRRSIVGITLTDTLDDFIQKRAITAPLAMRVLFQFDKIMTEALSTKTRARSSIKGKLNTYRHLDDVWTFVLSNVVLKIDEKSIAAPKLKIVACKKLESAN